MERTRDIKRQTDLRNIAVGIEMYRDQHGEFPFPTRNNLPLTDHNFPYNVYARAPKLSPALESYISSIPQDPKKNNFVDIVVGSDANVYVEKILKPGDYYYQLGQKNGVKYGVAALIAKPETADGANYVLLDRNFQSNFSKDGVGLEIFWSNESLKTVKTIADMNFCETIEKVKTKAEEQAATKTNKHCKYSSPEQLYYILRIE